MTRNAFCLMIVDCIDLDKKKSIEDVTVYEGSVSRILYNISFNST